MRVPNFVFVMLALVAATISEAQQVAGSKAGCDSFAGVFRAYGRITPEYDYGAPVPGEVPGTTGSINQAFMNDFLRCRPGCSLGMHSLYTSFALQYSSGSLRWAAVHSPSGDVVYHGKMSAPCKDGEIAYSKDAAKIPLSAFPYPPFPKGRSKDTKYMTIDGQGSLIGYRKKSFKGTVFIVIPVRSSKNSDWREFPPDTAIQRDATSIFADLPDTEWLEVVKVGDPKGNMHAKREEQLRPDRLLIANYGYDGFKIGTVGDISLTLLSVDQQKGKGGYYTISAEVIARSGSEEQTIHFKNDHSAGVDPQYMRVFDKDIALDTVSDQLGTVSEFKPVHAVLLIRK